MTSPTSAEMQIFAIACGFLASGTFMRFVVRAPARKPRGDERDGVKRGRPPS